MPILSGETIAYVLAVLCPAAIVSIKYALREITELKDKVVIITGASSGIGRACAKEFYEHGCQVVLCSRNVKKLKEVKEELMSQNHKVKKPIVIPLDIRDQNSISKAVEMIAEEFPNGIHVLINNAGITYRGEILSTSMDVYRKIMETNFFGQVAVTKGLLPCMLKLPFTKGKSRAHILSVNSIQGLIAIPQRSAYSVSKFASTSFFDCLRAELSALGIRVCNVFPSYVKTDISYNALLNDGSGYGKMDKNQETGMDPGYVSKEIVEAVRKNKEEVVISDAVPIFAIWLRFLLPFVYFRIMDRRAKRKLD